MARRQAPTRHLFQVGRENDGCATLALRNRGQLSEEPAAIASGADRAIRLATPIRSDATGSELGCYPVELATMLGDPVTSLPTVAARILSCFEPIAAGEIGWPQTGNVELSGHFGAPPER